MPRSAASDLGMHCLSMSHKKEAGRALTTLIPQNIPILLLIAVFNFIHQLF